MNIGAASIVEARYTDDGRPEFDAADFKELEARSRGPDVLSPAEMGLVIERKEEGNGHFRSGRVEDALLAYNRALEVFADRNGDPTQRLDKGKLLANRSECLLRLERWEAAGKSASAALRCDVTNCKARFRRARALAAMGGENHLSEALEDLEQLRIDSGGSHGKSEAKLLLEVKAMQAELKAVRSRDAAALRKAFTQGNARLAAEEEVVEGALPGIAGPGSSLACAQLTPEDAERAASWARTPRLAGDATLRHAWLIDCYRTRVDDDCAPGRTPHGLGAPACSAASVLLDFLIFCRLAVARGIIPPSPGAATTTGGAPPSSVATAPTESPPWNWQDFLAEAARMLGKAFNPEKCHAEHRYGPEMGRGEPMRAIASLVYDPAPKTKGPRLPSSEAVRRETTESCWRDGGVSEDGRRQQHMFTFDLNIAIFARVGGPQAWRVLLAGLGQAFGQQGTRTTTVMQ